MTAQHVLRVVARLKLLLTIRHFSKNWGNALATIVTLTLLGLLAVAGGMFLAAYCHSAGASFRDPALVWACWLLTILWIGAPFMQFDAQRNIDLNGLRLLPIGRTIFTLAVMFDAALSPLGLFYTLLLILMVVAFALNWLEMIILAAVLLVLSLCWLAVGQAIYLWANRLLTSRRFTDVSIIIGVVLVVGIQFVNIAFHNSDQLALPGWLFSALNWVWAIVAPLIHWLFPGVAAQIVAAVGQGKWLVASGLLAVLVAQTLGCMWLVGIAVRQFYEGELESSGQAAAVKRKRFNGSNRCSRAVAGAVGAIFHRERLYLWRDPMVKMLLLQSLFGAVYFVFVAVMLRSGDLPLASEFGNYAVLGMAVLLSYMESGSLFNKFGYEGAQLTQTLLSPLDRRRLLHGKSLYYLLHYGGINTVLILTMAVVLRTPIEYAVAAVLMVGANSAVIDVIGSFVSIYFPFGYRRQGRRLRPVMAQPGCGYMVIYMLVYQLCNLAVLPASAALGLGVVFFGWPGLFAGSLVATAIVISAYRFGVPLAAEHLLRREPELIASILKSND